jgi:hypothetical protein
LTQYAAHLIAVVNSTDPDREHEELCRGWAIGTSGWRRAIAKDHQHMALQPGIAREEIAELRHARWELALEAALRSLGRSGESLATDRKGAAWKRVLAARLRTETGASHAWIAQHLHMGSANSVRAWLNGSVGRKTDMSA